MAEKTKILFRADASKQIGYGHFVRSLALADMLKDEFNCIFCTQSPTPYQTQQVNSVCKLCPLPSDDSKFPLFLDMLQGDEIVVLDNFFYSLEYQKAIKSKGCRLVCMGGTDRQYAADLIISQATSDEKLFHSLPKTRYCLGLNWALLRRPFTQHVPILRQQRPPKSAVICFGGTDFYNFTGQTVEALCGKSDISRFEIIVGDVYEGVIKDCHAKKVHLHRNLSAQQIVDLFDSCDVAILSSSSIAIEAMACGIPVIAGWYVDNQDAFYHILESKKYIYGLGSLLEGDLNDKLVRAVNEINNFQFVSPFDDVNSIPKRYVETFKLLLQ